MEQDHLRIINYKVSGDNTLLDKLNHITPEVRRIIEEIHPDVEKGRKYLIKKLNKLCLKYPRVPVFKNLLSTVYQQNDNMKQAYAVNQWLVKEHPDYLFGKLNLAAELLLTDEAEKVPSILGETMEIGQLYPSRTEFHLEEVSGFNLISVQYFLAMDKIEEAEQRVKIMEDITPDHPKTLYAQQSLQEWFFTKASARKEEERHLRKSVVLKDERSHLQTTRSPQFHFPKEIAWLYQNDLNIEPEKIEILLKLDPDKLTEDLEKMLEDAIVRFDNFMKNEDQSPEKLAFPEHALLLLSALESEGSLAGVLQLLKQDQDFIDLWFEGFVFDILENALFHCGKNQTKLLFEFLKLPNVQGLNKSIVGEALVKIIINSEEKRAVFIEEYRQVLVNYIENAADENYVDTEAIGSVVADLMDLGYEELLPEIKQLFDLEIIGYWICGDYEEVATEIVKEPGEEDLEFIKTDIFEKYREFRESEEEEVNSFQEEDNYYNELYHRELMDQSLFEEEYIEPILKEKKIGRNDPCPCGSGKKYKKCCMDQL